MELQEIKTLWEELSIEIEKQKKATDSLLIKVTRSDYRNKTNKILIPEAIGGSFSALIGLFILIHFQELNTWYLVLCGVIAIAVMFLMPFLSIRAALNIRSVHIADNNFKESLLEYSKAKLHFAWVQKVSFYLGAMLVVVILPVLGKLIGGKDLFGEDKLWFWYAIGFPFFYMFYRWVSRCYIKATDDAKNILKELESD
jgi:hypothetical protein